ncbi:hypothetical protein [Streptomyces sp. MP131-18]|uniref:hypothetical protein n=1 Tax=Streptomyces sp. MP131-18 TaxID=1857892 RepID=UPI00117E4B1F|nr:hypothetical protein [Streptomyces sp. MP131-18]
MTLNIYYAEGGDGGSPQREAQPGPERSGAPRVPQTSEELSDILGDRPPMWEYLSWAGHLCLGVQSLETKRLDQGVGSQGRGHYLPSVEEAVAYIPDAFGWLGQIGESIMYWLAPEMQEKMFGPSGEPGDAVLIEHNAKRLLGVYDGFMDWAIDMRSCKVPAKLARLFQLAASYADRPALDFRNFVDSAVEQFDRFSTMDLHDPELRIEITLNFPIAIDPEAERAFHEEYDRVLKRSW